jgi:type II secretory pathway pseudopilin PulG
MQANKPVRFSGRPHPRPLSRERARGGYTLIEILLATALTLLMMAVVVQVFGTVGQSVTDTRAIVEAQNSLRAVSNRLKRDLEALTAPMLPPLRPEAGQGYFEFIEGPTGPVTTSLPVWLQPADTDVSPSQPDTTVRDNDDILMFTIRSRGEPFVGRFGNGTVESQEAEVAWFVRGRTLYRRVLLVAPGRFMALDTNGDGVVTPSEAGIGADSIFKWYDVSVRPAVAQDGTRGLVANTLGDLTKPENRYAHQSATFPYHPHYVTNRPQYTLGLPLLAESTSPAFFSVWLGTGTMPPIAVSQGGGAGFDAWRNPHPWNETDPETGILNAYSGPRVGEDIILNNVLDFDVKVFDPEARVVANAAGDAALVPGDPGYPAAIAGTVLSLGAYVDLGYGYGIAFNPPPNLPPAVVQALPGISVFSGLPGRYTFVIEPTYDTWSTHYENNWVDANQDGIRNAGDTGDENGNGLFDEGTNGIDDSPPNTPGFGTVDDPSEQEAPPPYPVALRGIQVKIRVFEPDTRQVRDITLVHDFTTK